MASRVNTKFVVILIVAVIAMLGMLYAAYSVVYKTAADVAAKGDQAIAAGNIEQARLLYAKAVNKDPTIVENLEKWIATLEKWTPDTETAYYDAFRNDYMGAIHQAAIVQRTNVDAYHRELGLQLDLLKQQYSRPQAERLIARTTEALGNFDGVPGVDPMWPTLRRYRGIGWQQIADKNGVIDEVQHEVVMEDLDAALEADPSDEFARTARMRWMVYLALKDVQNNNIAPAVEARMAAIQMGKDHLAQFPDSPLVLVSILALEVELVGADAFVAESDSKAERTQAILQSWEGLLSKLDTLFERLMEIPDEKMNLNVINRFVAIELRVDPESQLGRASQLMERLRAYEPDSLNVLVATASLYAIRGENDNALEMYEQIVERPVPPISSDGVLLFNAKREALLTLTSMKLDRYARLKATEGGDQAELDGLLTEAKGFRSQFAATVSEDNTNLMYIDGRIALINEQFEEALRLLKLFNGQTENASADGLWFEALAARELNQLGTARDALLNLIVIKQHDVRALSLLANIEMKLKDYRSAKVHYEMINDADPGNAVAAQGLASISAYNDPSLVEDPVVSLVLTARQLRRGRDGNPGDLSAAIRVLTTNIESEEINYDPAVTRELVSYLLDNNELARSREYVAKSIERHPEDESLALMKSALENDNEVDILVAMIRSSVTDPVDQLVSIAGIALTRDAPELLDQTIAQLKVQAPNDPRTIDLAFVRAIATENFAEAQQFAQKASEINADRVNGLSYRARLASSQGDHVRAVQLLEQAASSGVADASVFRMMGTEQRIIGEGDAAVTSFEEALSIRPDDQATIEEYLTTLIMLRRYDEAIDVARRFQNIASESPRFLSLWLSLEASYGGPEGQEFAIRQREKFLELDPKDSTNNYALALLYIQTSRWAESRRLIDELKSVEDSLRVTQLEAQWFANQGRVGNQNGLAAARQVYLEYIERHADEDDAQPYIDLARFMIDRGRPDLAVQAATDAVEHQQAETLDGTKLLGDIYMLTNNFNGAADAFRKVVNGGADEDDQYRLRLIDMLIRTRQFEGARAQFDQLASESATTRIAMLQNAEIEEGLGNKAKASEMLDLAVATYSNDALVYIKRAEFLSGSEETMTDMLADIDAALQLSPNDWRAYRVRAAAYFDLDQREEALRDLQRAVRLNPSLDQALFGIVNEMMIDGRTAEAYDFSIEIVEKRSRDATLINSLGQLFSSRGDWEHAAMLYKLVWEVQRSPNAGATLIDAIVRTRNPDTNLANAVINDLTQIAGDINKSPGLLAAQALVLKARGRDELAIQQLTKAFDLSTNDDAQLIQWSGNISRYFEDQSMQDQVNYIETIKRRNPNREVLNWLDLFIAQRLTRIGSQVDTAFAVFQRLMNTSEQPEIQRITFQTYGTSLYTQGEYEKAAEIWSRGVELFPEDWEMSNNLAYVLSAEMGEHDRALALAQSAIAANPSRSEPYDTIGNVYIALGQYDQAEKMLNEGMRYALSVRARVTLVLAQINLDLAKGLVPEARSKMLDIRNLMRSMPTRDLGLEEQVDEVEEKIDSAG
tara:strand:- start:3525 stop:8162 length:4638 start_codon:yes stop_codon:yes gene_type:complete